MYNWLKLAWQIRDSGDDKWYNIVMFDSQGNYIVNNAHIFQILGPLEQLTLWNFHYDKDVTEKSQTMEKILTKFNDNMNTRISVLTEDRGANLKRVSFVESESDD